VVETVGRLELARMLAVTPRTVDRWRREGLRGVRLPSVRVGGHQRFRLCDFAWWQEELERRSVPPEVPAPSRSQRRDRERLRRDLERHGITLPEDGQ
jgi:hypothetical protein